MKRQNKKYLDPESVLLLVVSGFQNANHNQFAKFCQQFFII